MLQIKDGLGAQTALATTEDDGVHTPTHRDADRETLLEALAPLATVTGQAAVVAAVEAVVAKLISAPATAAKQDALKASIDTLTAAIRPPQNHFAVVPGADALANPTKRIVCNAGGTLTVTAGGVNLSYTVTAGQWLDIVATHITAAPANTVGQY